MAEFINEKDSLNTGRKKINKAIEHADDAKKISEQADEKATQALDKSESTQEQLDQVVIEGDSSVEAAQARVNADDSKTYDTLKDRLDTEYEETQQKIENNHEEVTSQLAETVQEIDQIGTTTITRANDLLISEVDMPQKKITFKRSSDGTITSTEESYNERTIKTTISRDDDGIVQQFNRGMV